MPTERRHQALYELSNSHRVEHGELCLVFPSPRAPLWATIAAAMSVERVLEVGCGIGYQAVCIAAAASDCHVETIENDPQHVEIARAEISQRGLADKITVLQGDAESILPGLVDPYDLVVEDAGIDYAPWLQQLTRLTRPGGLLITRNLSEHIPDWEQQLPIQAMTISRERSSDAK